VASPVHIVGTATDDTGVADVRIGIRDQASKLWLQPDGTFGAYALRAAMLANPNAPSTGFTAIVTLPPGSYGVSARATDVGGTADSTDAWIVFSVA